MASMAVSVAETVAGMQRLISRDDYESSDGEEPYLQPTNHGNKLKRKSQQISREGDGDQKGLKIRRRTLKLAGHTREILRRNPKRYDDDGDELATDEEDEAADARAADENPYSGVKLESILAPLTTAANLPKHPSMAIAYTSRALADMVQHACDVVRRERVTLANAKRMLTKLRGDDIWAPPGKLQGAHDHEIFDTTKIYTMILAGAPDRQSSTVVNDTLDGLQGDSISGKIFRDAEELEVPKNVKASQASSKTLQHDDNHESSQTNGTRNIEDNGENQQNLNESGPSSRINDEFEAGASNVNGVNGNSHAPSETRENESVIPSVESKSKDEEQNAEATTENGQAEHAEGSRSPPRRITRAQAQADKVTSRSESPREWVPPLIHPLFELPPSAQSDSDLGLPGAEAQDTRHLLAMYVQKQEEVCRGAEKLYEGLLQADRQRQEVLKWCKAEGHTGEMSDGEDWYDKEEWGLEEDLRKGHAEEEEDTAVQGKKTRGRRA